MGLVEEGAHFLDGALAGGGDVRQGTAAGGFHRAGLVLGLLQIGGVAAGAALNHAVLAGVGEHHEFVRLVAAHGAGVGLDHLHAQAAALEDAHVGVVHRLVAARRAVPVGVEAVGVLHHELAGAHEAEARADLVAELGLDLVEIDGELLVGVDLARGEVGDHFLVGRPEQPVGVLAVLDLEDHVLHGGVAAGALPQLGGVQGGHEDLGGPGAVHFLAHDRSTLRRARRPRGRKVKMPESACG